MFFFGGGTSKDSKAGEKEIRQAFLQQAKQHHPDKGGSAAAFREVVRAYEALINILQQLPFA